MNENAKNRKFRNERNRRVCREQACDIEIPDDSKYCDVHAWIIGKWLVRSEEMLANLKKQEAA